MQTKDETSEVAEESSKSKTEEEPPKENMMTKVSPRSAVSMRACICLCFVSVCFQACTYTTPMTHTVIRAVCVCVRARACVRVCVCLCARASVLTFVRVFNHAHMRTFTGESGRRGGAGILRAVGVRLLDSVCAAQHLHVSCDDRRMAFLRQP